MILFLVNPGSQEKRQQGIEDTDQVKAQRGKVPVDDHRSKILDIAIYRVQQKNLLNHIREGIHRIEDGGHIHQQRQEYLVQIAGIPEENEHCRQHHTYAQIEKHHAEGGNQQGEEAPGKGDPVQPDEEKKQRYGDGKVDQGRNILRQYKDVFRHIHFGEDMSIVP